MSAWLVHDMVRSGRCSPADGARLLELRDLVAWARLPWWRKALRVLWRMVTA